MIHPNPDQGRMPHPQPVHNVPGQARPVAVPTHDDHGQRLGGQPIQHAPNTTIVNQTINNTTIINNIHQRVIIAPQVGPGYYWFYYGGGRWCHYYDTWGVNWFGFYVGDVYFWTRWYNDRLWWEDYQYHRWLYFHDGTWWWQDGTVVYIYRGGYYYRYTPIPGGYETLPPADSGTPAQPSYFSADGSRLVQIVDQNREAYLYDNTGSEPAVLALLTDWAEKVEFSNPTNGSAVQVLVTRVSPQDGKSFLLFDANGNPLTSAQSTRAVDTEKQFERSGAFQSLQSGTPNW